MSASHGDALPTRGRARSVLRPAMLVAFAAAASGCTLGPDFTRPTDLPAPVEYRGVLQPQQAESFADLAWADVFDDPGLRTAIELALRNNLDLRIAAARVEEFRSRVKVSRSFYGPDLRLTGGTSPSPGAPDDSTYTLGLGLNWEIDLFGRLRRANEATRAQLLAVEDVQRGVINSLVADVATTWFRLREIDEQIAIIDRTIASQQGSLELVQSLKRNGVASATEEQQALSQLAGTRVQLPLAEQRRVQTENLLRYLLGGEPGPVTPPLAPPGFAVPEQIPVGLPAQLLSRRPDLRQLENELHAATANVGVAEASRFPYLSIGLTSFFGLVSTELGSLLDGSDPAVDLFSIGPFVDVPLFQSGRGTGNVETARAQLLQSELAYRRGVLNAYRETADALVITDKVRSVIEQGVVRRDAARRVLELQQKRYRAGVVSYLEVLDAERVLFAAEIDLARARLDQRIGYVELYRALGGGWK
jgi:outer membrane protein, multidrug efflux system